MAQILKRNWNVLIVDEAHALKNRTAKRTKKIYGPRCERIGGIAEKAERTWLLTGTPTPNHAGELYPHLRALWPDTIRTSQAGPMMNEDMFVEAFCTFRTNSYGRQITGSKNQDALAERMNRAGVMLRRRKAEVLKDLPPLTFSLLPVHPSDASNLPQHLLSELSAAEVEATKALEMASDIVKANDAPIPLEMVLRSLRMDAHIATQRRLAGMVKAHVVTDLVVSELETHQRKIILFAHHQSVIDEMVGDFRFQGLGVVKIDGRDGPAARQAAIDGFQTDPKIRIFVGQIQAAGTSITLTAASDVILVEPSWVPNENVQAACRAHRIGQKDGVLVRVMALAGTIDSRILDVVARKSAEIAQLIDAGQELEIV